MTESENENDHFDLDHFDHVDHNAIELFTSTILMDDSREFRGLMRRMRKFL